MRPGPGSGSKPSASMANWESLHRALFLESNPIPVEVGGGANWDSRRPGSACR